VFSVGGLGIDLSLIKKLIEELSVLITEETGEGARGAVEISGSVDDNDLISFVEIIPLIIPKTINAKNKIFFIKNPLLFT
jgi:hypothetical protein